MGVNVKETKKTERVICTESGADSIVEQNLKNKIRSYIERDYKIFKEDNKILLIFYFYEDDNKEIIELKITTEEINEQTFIEKLYEYGIMEQFKIRIENVINSYKKAFITSENNSYITKMALLLELIHYTEDLDFINNFSISNVETFCRCRKFFDILFDIFDNSDYGNSYTEIKAMLKEILEEI